jgi:hypothetical protein
LKRFSFLPIRAGTTLGVVTLLGAMIFRAQFSAAADPAPLTPAATLAAFSKALEEGDAKALSNLVSGDEKEKAWVVAFAGHLRAFGDLEQALGKRFGKDYTSGEAGKEIRERLESARDEDLIADLKHAKVGKPDGQTQLIILDEAASDDRQGRLTNVEGRWKIELGSLSNYFSVNDTAGLNDTAKTVAGLARDVGAGKFTSLEEATQAVEDRLSAAN